jgi:prepilin-type processing-associated H-X9-DG protein/prepilin-type N-terminal cleavage/methylation domain-containing protein
MRFPCEHYSLLRYPRFRRRRDAAHGIYAVQADGAKLRLPENPSSAIPAASLRAFTLIELLTVIVIIGILAAIIIPTVSKIRESSHRAVCSGNLRQIGTALLLYTQDHKNKLPACADVWGVGSQYQMWGYKIWTYAGYPLESFNPVDHTNDFHTRESKVRNIFHCPATRSKGPDTPRYSNDPAARPNIANLHSYGLNSGPVDWNDNDAWWIKEIPVANVRNPALCAMVTESSFVIGGSTGFLLLNGMLPHNDGANVLFYDGHVKYLKRAHFPGPLGTPPIPLHGSSVYYNQFWRGN